MERGEKEEEKKGGVRKEGGGPGLQEWHGNEGGSTRVV